MLSSNLVASDLVGGKGRRRIQMLKKVEFLDSFFGNPGNVGKMEDYSNKLKRRYGSKNEPTP
jgi:hypothetical protein